MCNMSLKIIFSHDLHHDVVWIVHDGQKLRSVYPFSSKWEPVTSFLHVKFTSSDEELIHSKFWAIPYHPTSNFFKQYRAFHSKWISFMPGSISQKLAVPILQVSTTRWPTILIGKLALKIQPFHSNCNIPISWTKLLLQNWNSFILKWQPNLFLKQAVLQGKSIGSSQKAILYYGSSNHTKRWMSQPSHCRHEWPQISSQGFNPKGLNQDLPSSQKSSQLEWQTGRGVMWTKCKRTKESMQE